MHAASGRRGEDVIVDIGDVAHATRLVAEIAQSTLEYVIRHIGRRMAHVRGVVGRDAADVHRDDRAGLEGHHGADVCVVELHRRAAHRSDSDRVVDPDQLQRDTGLVADVELE